MLRQEGRQDVIGDTFALRGELDARRDEGAAPEVTSHGFINLLRREKPAQIGAKTEMAPASDVMLLRIRTRALAADQKVIRSLIEHFGGSALTKQLVCRSGDPEFIRLENLERARAKASGAPVEATRASTISVT